ncbi:MFS transporter [Geobacter sp. FeAm09]|uniref:spinster family MFS transporter n=1 Tax=Geobacter sp. FeAm09 TaxID=2597769 RepID=UPI0011EFCDD8|nr:MFS transporter [Geobacter sp. FeAm09]QEM69525.1 MFS transporter [Geobacter sp. FeAm09]
MSDAVGRRGRYALALLLAVNLLNYVDRQALYAVFSLIKADLRLSDTALGLLGSAFMLCYMVAAPFFGRLGDRCNRNRLAAGGLFAWSLATMLSGWAPSYRLLLAARSLVGMGEASFGTVSPGLVADFFPRERRGRMLSLFFLAIPVGSALGYILGGSLGQAFGWRRAFMLVGLPGLALAAPLWFLAEPRRGRATPDESPAGEGLAAVLRSFAANRTFVHATLSMAAMTFALGGLAQWVPSFLHRSFSLDVARGNTLFGMLTVVAGIVGTLAGGWLGDRLQRRSAAGYLHVSAAGFLLGAPLAALAILSHSLPLCLAAIFAAELFLFLNTGPLNTVLVNVVAPNRRATGFAITIFTIHALGDAVSPAIIGALSDVWGLAAALLTTPAAILVAALFALLAGRTVAGDQRAAEA